MPGAEKIIGKSLEAQLEITVSGEKYDLLNSFCDKLAAVFIVSGVKLLNGGGEELSVKVMQADGEKCDRCWTYTDDGEKTEDGYLCARCLKTIKEI